MPAAAASRTRWRPHRRARHRPTGPSPFYANPPPPAPACGRGFPRRTARAGDRASGARGQGLMGAAAKGLCRGLLAGAEPHLFALRRHPLHRRKRGALVRAIAERLVLRLAAGAPPVVLAGFHIDADRPGSGDHGFVTHGRSPCGRIPFCQILPLDRLLLSSRLPPTLPSPACGGGSGRGSLFHALPPAVVIPASPHALPT